MLEDLLLVAKDAHSCILSGCSYDLSSAQSWVEDIMFFAAEGSTDSVSSTFLTPEFWKSFSIAAAEHPTPSLDKVLVHASICFIGYVYSTSLEKLGHTGQGNLVSTTDSVKLLIAEHSSQLHPLAWVVISVLSGMPVSTAEATARYVYEYDFGTDLSTASLIAAVRALVSSMPTPYWQYYGVGVDIIAALGSKDNA